MAKQHPNLFFEFWCQGISWLPPLDALLAHQRKLHLHPIYKERLQYLHDLILNQGPVYHEKMDAHNYSGSPWFAYDSIQDIYHQTFPSYTGIVIYCFDIISFIFSTNLNAQSSSSMQRLLNVSKSDNCLPGKLTASALGRWILVLNSSNDLVK